MNFLKSKYIYMLFLVVICLSMMVIVPTYAKFGSSYATSDVATFSVLFDVSLESVEEYEELVVEAGSKYKFNVYITNDTKSDIYYGIWYRMVSPSTLTNDISIGRLSGTLTTTSGLINSGNDTIVTVVVVNNSKSDIVIDLGVASSYDGVDDISYVNGKYLISKDILIPTDISIASVVIDGVNSDTLPVSGLYDMKYTCNKGTSLKWDKFSKVLTYNSGSYVMDECSLEFSSSDYLPLLNEMKVGSYVSYVGDSGIVGDSVVSCGVNGNINSCSGENVNEELEQANSNTYGFCYSSDYRYYSTGFRNLFTTSLADDYKQYYQVENVSLHKNEELAILNGINTADNLTYTFSEMTSDDMNKFNEALLNSNHTNKNEYNLINDDTNIIVKDNRIISKKEGNYSLLFNFDYIDGNVTNINVAFKESNNKFAFVVLKEKPDSNNNIYYDYKKMFNLNLVNYACEMDKGSILTFKTVLYNNLEVDSNASGVTIENLFSNNSNKKLIDTATGWEINKNLFVNSKFQLNRNYVVYFA